MTLPEQGGFNERLDEIFAYFNSRLPQPETQNEATRRVEHIKEAQAAIRTLVLEEIIGEDEYWDKWSFGIDGEYEMVTQCEKPQKKRHRDELRNEQRKKLEGSDGTK